MVINKYLMTVIFIFIDRTLIHLYKIVTFNEKTQTCLNKIKQSKRINQAYILLISYQTQPQYTIRNPI